MPRRHLKRLVATLVVFVFLGLPTDGDAVAQQKTGAGLSKEELVGKATDHMANDRWAEATNLGSMVIEIDPFYVVGYLNRAMSRFRAGDCDGREVDARRALEVIADSTGLVLPQLESLVYRAQALGHLQNFADGKFVGAEWQNVERKDASRKTRFDETQDHPVLRRGGGHREVAVGIRDVSDVGADDLHDDVRQRARVRVDDRAGD